ISIMTGLCTVANYPPMVHTRLAGQMPEEKIRIFDLRIPGEHARFLRALRQEKPILVGISVMFTSNGEEAMSLASQVRQVLPETVIVLGGTAPSEEPMAYFDCAADFITYRAGDQSLPALVRDLRAGQGLPQSPAGFFYREDGAWKLGPAVPAVGLSQLKPY